VLADVEVAGLDDRFIGRRLPVRLPIGAREVLLVPETALERHSGLDFVTVEAAGHQVQRAVVPGRIFPRDGVQWVEVLSGLNAGDMVVTTHE